MEEQRGEVFSKKKAMGQKRLLGCATPGLKHFPFTPGLRSTQGREMIKSQIWSFEGA